MAGKDFLSIGRVDPGVRDDRVRHAVFGGDAGQPLGLRKLL